MNDWYVPGAMVQVTPERVIRLRPPEYWPRFILEIPRVPPSMNSNEIRSNWRGFQKHKKSWQEEIGLGLMEHHVGRGCYQRAVAGCFMRFPKRAARRDPPNFSGLVNKACGDALVVHRAIADDDGPHYVWGGVEFKEELGPACTWIYLYLQPQED